MILAGSGLSLLLACGGARDGRLAAARDHAALVHTADAYWYALRWNDANAAASAWADPRTRVLVTRMVVDPTIKITDYAVLQVEIGVVLPPERAPVDREGIALVRVEAYANAGTKLVTETIQQHWEHWPGVGWLVDQEKSPLGEDRPWVTDQKGMSSSPP